MKWAGAATVNGAPHPLKVTVLASPIASRVSLAGSTLGVAVSVSRALTGVPDPPAVVVQSRMYTFWPPAIAVLTRLTCAAAGRRLDGSAAMVFSAARSWYSAVPALIATHRLPTRAAL